MLTVRELTAQALASVADDPEGCALQAHEVYRRLDALGASNPHLANPTRNSIGGWSLRRTVPLSGEEPVHGAHLLFVYCSHDPFIQIREYKTLEDLETALLVDVFNPLLTYVVPFIASRFAPFAVTYLAPGDSRLIYTARWDTEKSWIDSRNLDSKFPSRRIEWADA